ncbi:MAG: TM0106 family RecB-like putative nuclease, partial [Chloroflexi bacterium]|nr:TM0106 family RecB-like putative nuclease [Chloroflexota bacterium]
MQVVEGQLVLSPSDLVGHLYCEHLTRLEVSVTRGETARPVRADAQLDLLAERGLDHEARELARRRASGARVVEITRPEHGAFTLAGLREAHERTVAAMGDGPDVIYQAAFFDGRWLGYADFLERVERPSALGAWSYEVADTKLARSVRASAVVQLASYAEHVARVQAAPVERIHVITGDNKRQTVPLGQVGAYYRTVKARFERALAAGDAATYPDAVEHCGTCRWAEVCDARRRADDHLTLVANLRGEQARKLAAAGVATVAALGASAIAHVPRIGDATLGRLRAQARLQVERRESGRIPYEELPLEPRRGFALLPAPSSGDVFVDMEGDPFFVDDASEDDPGGLEYLFGLVTEDGGGHRFTAFWGHDRPGEKRAFEDAVDFLVARLDADPAMHVYHYASYERTALSRLAQRHGTREMEVDRLLRGEALVDLHQVVRQALLIGTESYSIKKLEPLYMAKRTADIKEAGGSVVAYEEWVRDQDPGRLEQIRAYNEEDCVSTALLRGWLEARRADAERRLGPIARPAPADGDPSDAQRKEDAESAGLISHLRTGLPEDRTADDPEQRARRLLAALLSWHRREARPQWWEHFRRLGMTDEELFEESGSIAGLVPTGKERPEKKSRVREFRFEHQEHKFDVDDKAFDPATTKEAGDVTALDSVRGLIELKQGPSRDIPRAIISEPPRNDAEQRKALRAAAQHVLESGFRGEGPFRAVREFLLGAPPRVRGAAAGA